MCFDLCVSPLDGEESAASSAATGGAGGRASVGASPSATTGASPSVRDRFCWVCHKDKSNIVCKQCPRSYHMKCIAANGNTSSLNNTNSDNKTKSNNKALYESWVCIECKDILNEEHNLRIVTAEEAVDSAPDSAPKSQLAQMSAEEMSQLLAFAVHTIRQTADPSFHKPVQPIVFPDYHQLVHCPMDLSTIEKNVKAHRYRSQTGFLADIKWIVHNCIIYNHNNHPLTTNAKYLSRVAKNEMAEMEICPDCFKNFYTVTDTSFAEPCRRPHQLVFARVKGYPLWPAKIVRLGGKPNEVDCRFFGTHDRAFVTADLCWLVSEVHPGGKPNKTHKSKFESAMRELALHIDRINAKFPTKFKYSPQKTQLSTKEIYIFDDDNEYYSKLIASQLQTTTGDKSPNGSDNSADISANNNGSDTNDRVGDDCPANTSKLVIPGVFSLSSDKVLDDLKSEIKISNESTNLLNKNIKGGQIKEESGGGKSCAARTARVGKRNVAEALRASKIPRTTSTSSSSAGSSPSHRMQANQSSLIIANSTHSMASNATPGGAKSKATAAATTPTGGSLSQQAVTSSSSPTSSSGNTLVEELEKLRKKQTFDNAMHRQQIKEIQHNHDLVLSEMRQSWVTERDRALEDERQKHELQLKLTSAQFESEKKKLMAAVDETKRKQWCAECLKEAQLFCCYDTWYCTYDCQKNHWKSHVNVCQQIHKKS
ncbi:unnamed protein product [Medioppia subpectinata]|uniref:Protein kinase C-binding protein 1 n=1 Tax=Medioppia subpectinata TaxID=1979941 RepID=A0A7R9KZ78_9ACAR|nr:unnamed protein product [Medioppia subpectinata]CAG2112271.1 unnamed protein product [Medioppia subpectinata]